MSHREDLGPTPRFDAPGPAAEDAARVEAYLSGDARVFRELDGWIRSEILARYPGLGDEHEDLCQTVHEKLLGNLRAGRFERRSALRTYVTGIAHHTAIDRLRQIRRQREALVTLSQQPRTDWEVLRWMSESEQTALLHRVVVSLPRHCRELWRMVFLDRLSYEEIGRQLAVPEGTVKSRMWHCRKKAKTALGRFRHELTTRESALNRTRRRTTQRGAGKPRD